ncbi:MAG: glycoside hydrolase family 88 protein [Eubacteriales bacterium]|nr:glycoside hydrolase family 88 protein [Eubacteriales bacterium]
MNKIIIGLMAVALAVCLINYGIDAFFYLKNRYCRFHIGRWKQEEWEKAVEKKAVKWLKKTPTVKITDNSRYMLLDFLNGKYRSKTIQSWQKAALILGLLEGQSEVSKKAAEAAAEALIDSSGNWKEPPVAVDCGMLSYAVLKASSDPQKIKPAMDISIAVIKKNINEERMVSYTGGKENPDMYVDTIGLVCPFLALYAEIFQSSEWEDIAFYQIKMFHQYGLYENTALPNHAFHIKSKLPLGVYGWGRGTAWYVIGLMDTYKNIKKKEYKDSLKEWIFDAAEKYLVYQRQDGGFGAILQRTQTYDSSATAALAWFYMNCYKIFSEEKYKKIAEKCMKKLLSCTRITGAIDWCQGDTKDIGVFAQTYDLMPFAQGMALRAMDLK